ncbi:MAG TPA: DEAD/DEAH box helicase [Nitrososphaeraceae archaeon]|nr:DEAD/DEAH box helicase [Nitrososphaeraceae archaeon]
MKEYLDELLKSLKYDSLYPPQEVALSKGVMNGNNVLVTTPTSSGKTLIGLMGMINILNKGKKVVYLTPLKALATEKFNEFKVITDLSCFRNRRVNIGISTGDYDSSGSELVDKDVIILTNEKMDSILRHDPNWIYNVGLFIIDEIHLLTERERGPTLEIILTKIKLMPQKPQIIGISATVSNSDEVAEWLTCEPIQSNWRPTELIEGVYNYGKVTMNDGTNYDIDNIGISDNSTSAITSLAMDSITNDGGQSLVFAETRKRTVSLAKKTSEIVAKFLDKTSLKLAQKTGVEILKEGDDTELNRTLSSTVGKGVGFHHAGLGAKSRQIVEKAFRNGIVKILFATPTLAAGVNLPARRVIITSIFRYDYQYGGNVPMSVLQYKQICGRAGRPAYDKYGEAIIIADSRTNPEDLYNHFVLGVPEPIVSQLMDERALRVHVLGVIASKPKMLKSELLYFFEQTFLSKYQGNQTISFEIESLLTYLGDEKLIIMRNDLLIATKFGKRISLLYIDPKTGIQFKKHLDSYNGNKYYINDINSNKHENNVINFLYWICDCYDFYPKLTLRQNETEYFQRLFEKHKLGSYGLSNYDYSLKNLVILLEWIDESSEANLNEKIGVEPGDLHRMVETTYWLLYCLYEIAKLIERKDLLAEINILRLRIRHGVKLELIPLIQLEGIGRIRARSLYRAGITDVAMIEKISESKLGSIPKIGVKLARKLKSQIKS